MEIKKNFFQTKYFLSCLSYGVLMASSVSIRVSLVFILGFIFSLTDSEKFVVYSSFTVASDLTPIISSYLALNFLRSQIICIFGFFLSFLGVLIFSYSLFWQNINFFYLGLAFISIGFGIIRSNLMSINSEYLNLEFKENKKEFGSLLYFFVILSCFLVIFFGGFFLKRELTYIIFIISGLIFISFSFFIYMEKYRILEKKPTTEINLKKFFQSIFIIFASILFAFSFYFFGKINLLFNLPLLFFIGFYGYLIYRAKKNNDEKESIWFAIYNSIIVFFLLMIERQRDTSIALFILRNVDYIKFGLSPIQINTLFFICSLAVNLIFFKAKIHSKINLSKLFSLTPLLIFLTFIILYINCFFPNSDGKVRLFPYLISMIFMSSANVLVFARYSEVCAFSIQKIRILISSFMISSMGLGFYLTRFIGKFMEINKENSDPFYSLKIYQSGFLKISLICLFFLFCVLIFNFAISKKNALKKNYNPLTSS